MRKPEVTVLIDLLIKIPRESIERISKFFAVPPRLDQLIKNLTESYNYIKSLEDPPNWRNKILMDEIIERINYINEAFDKKK